jgi:hypothetical protein
MTPLSMVIRLMPLFTFSLIIAALVAVVQSPTLASVAALLFVIYLLPPLAYRLHNYFLPLEDGIEDISEPGRYCRWWGTYQIQIIYYVIPQLEWILRLVPGLYSSWLRLWGSQIGKGIFWSPNVEILDRGMIEVGDYAIFGHKSKLSAHIVTPKRGRIIVFVKKVRVGHTSFVGAFSGLGPGSVLSDGEILPIMSRLVVSEKLEDARTGHQ